MALVINTVLESSSANSYAEVAEVDAYHEARLHNSLWTAITDAELKKAAIIWATRIVDLYMLWKGAKKTSTQALKWPRLHAHDSDGFILGYDYVSKSYVIAQAIKDAVSELAFLLVESDIVSDSDSSNLSGLKVDVISLNFNSKSSSNAIPSSVVDMLREYGSFSRNNIGMVPLVRTY